MLNIDILNVSWFILGIIQIAIGISFFRKYRVDKDKRKLMFGFAFFIISYSHFYEAFITNIVSSNFPLILENIQYWSYYPLVFAIGVATHHRFLKTVSFDKIYNVFLILSILFFPLIVFNPLPANEYAGIIAILISSEIVIISFINIWKNRDTYNVLMLLANICYIIGGIELISTDYSNSFFAFLLGDLLILFMFLLSENMQDSDKSTISNYFTIQNKLTETKIELRRTSEKYRRLIEMLPEGVITVDRFGRITYANYESQKIFNISFSDSKGKSFATFMTKDSWRKAIQLLTEIKKGKDGKKVELEAIHQDGHIFPIEIWATALERDGVYDGLICVIRDITKKIQSDRNLKESENKFRSLVEQAAEMLFLHDTDGNLLDVNIASVKSTGFSREELLTMNVFDIDPDAKDRNDMQNYWKRLGPDDPPATFEGRHQRKDGTIYEAGISVSKVVIANKEYIMGLARDITKRKHAEEELKLAHKELQRMNETLEKKVIDRTEQIQLLLKQKDEFIHQLGHDLKNPLGPLVNLLPILDKRTTNQKDKEILEVIQRNVEYMKNLVKKTLELAQLNSPNTALNFEQVNLKNLVDDIIQQNSYLFETKHISILSNLSFDLIVSVDVLRFEELMNNLISNAVKYTTENGSVVIDSFLKEDMLTISVQDTGKGMTSKQINHVFDEFYKADESRHNIESSGLGMPICKRIVEKHGGQIWVESNGVDKGSTFYFTLPLHQDVYGEVINKVDMLLKEN